MLTLENWLIARAVAPYTAGMTHIEGEIVWKMEEQKTLYWPVVLSGLQVLWEKL